MIKEIKSSVLKKLMPMREAGSHKGENGRVLIVGGSMEYFGAPVLAGMGAISSGADLVFLYVPECIFDVARHYYPDFIVRKFKGDYLNNEAASEIVEFGKEVDSILIGPGLGKKEESLEAVLSIIEKLPIPTVLDTSAMLALKKASKFPFDQPITITPHANEFKNLVDKDVHITEDDPKSVVLLRSLSMDLHINVLLKAPIDLVASEEGIVEKNVTGNAGMTVGGSGDVLAGAVASLMAQGWDGFDAARAAAYYVGQAGDILKKQKGYNFTASEIAGALGVAMK
jgi:ADP-dependent NAD(P)H-hydrate dehydratase / NAD(P)H-hydrate epimerase